MDGWYDGVGRKVRWEMDGEMEARTGRRTGDAKGGSEDERGLECSRIR